MKKLFLLIPALVLSLITNAAVINITPTSPHSSNNLRQAIAAASTGDIVEMAAGTYVETGNWIAFDDKEADVSKIEFLTKFANYGVTKLLDQVGSDELETMEKLKIFLTSSMEGSNFDIDSIDDLLDEIDDEP